MRLCSYNSCGSTRHAAVKGNLGFIAAIGTRRRGRADGMLTPRVPEDVGAAALRLGEIPGEASIASA